METPVREIRHIGDLENNRKLIEKIRKREPYFLRRFKEIQEIKKLYILRNEELASRIMETLEDENFEKIFYLKRTVKPHEMEIMKREWHALFQNASISTKRLMEISPDPFLINLYEEEKMIISYEIIMHFPQVMKSVNTFKSKIPMLKKHVGDLRSAGVVGIVHAMHNYDPDKGVKFITYAFNWIRFHINRSVSKIIDEKNFSNGTYQKYLFDGKVIRTDYVSYIKDLHNSEIDFINLYPQFDFISEKTLRTNWNSFLKNGEARKDFLRRAAFIDKVSPYLSMDVEDKLIARIILEKLIPSLTSKNLENYEFGTPDAEAEITRSVVPHGFDEESEDLRSFLAYAKKRLDEKEYEKLESYMMEECRTLPTPLAEKIRNMATEFGITPEYMYMSA